MLDTQDSARRADAHGAGKNGSSAGPEQWPYHSMRDLEARASALDLDDHPTINQLVRLAEESVQNAKTYAQHGQLDLALVQHIRASDLAVNMIPNHPDFQYMNQHHARWADQFSALIMAVNSQQEAMEAIKRKVISDKAPPSNRSRPGSQAGVRQFQHSPANGSSTNTGPAEPPLRMPSPTSFQAQPSNARASSSQQSSPSRSAGDPLTQRFAELRNSRYNKTSAIYDRNGARQEPTQSAPSNAYGSLGQTPRQFVPGEHLPSKLDPPPTRPMGPREMNSSHQAPPAVPPKVALHPSNSSTSSLPKCPSPAYSPARLVSAQPPPNPPRTSTESSRSAVYQRDSSRAGTPNGMNNVSVEENPYRSRTPNGVHFDKGPANEVPHIGSTIRAEQLMECLRKLEVLLIDVRPRIEFDGGHIHAKSVMCIEPVILKEGVSAEELEERLVISPEIELSLFSRRDEFDLIVYYDQSTREPSYLVGSPVGTSMPHLRALYDTLYEFNMYKPLKGGREPALLEGGIDSWVELVGQHGLATSRTAAILSTIRANRSAQRSGQPLHRVPTASANSSWEVKKRRLRDYRPLDKEEERDWLEKAKNEEIDPGNYGLEDGAITEEPEGMGETHEEPHSPFAQTYEDALRRFPDPRDIPESMMFPPSTETRAPSFQDKSTMAPPSRPPPAVPRRSYGGVSDGGQIQPPLARQSSATKQALYTSNSMGRLKLPRTGLVNLGQTCYMNSIVQCMSATGLLTMFFMDNRFHEQVQRNWKGSQGVLPGLYANLVRSLWKGDVEIIRPTSFRKFIGRLNTEWASNQQQDAKEFFDVLIDCLHEDLNLHYQKHPIDPLTFEQEMRRERMPIHRVCNIEWDRYSHRECSYVSQLFAGQHASRLRCTSCQNTSTTYEAFFSISVEIPTSGTGDIYQCLRSYCQEEKLSSGDLWKCPHCRQNREATKRILLTRAPNFLVIHFKRFTASRRQQARKIHTPINFPLTGLDMSPYMLASPQPQDGNYNNGNKAATPSMPQSAMSRQQLATSPPYLYNAYAVVRHIGSTMHEGHYIALARDQVRGCWRQFDDQKTTDFKPGNTRLTNLTSEEAYIVFYERALVN